MLHWAKSRVALALVVLRGLQPLRPVIADAAEIESAARVRYGVFAACHQPDV